MVAVTNSVNAYLKNTDDDMILNVLPLAFGYGLYQLFLAAQVGATVVLDKGFAFPARTVALLEQEHVTALPGVPMLYALLLKYPDLLKRDLSHLRYMTNAARPYLPPTCSRYAPRCRMCSSSPCTGRPSASAHLLFAARRRR